MGDWEAGLGLADWIGARPEEASGPRPSQTWLCARSGPGGERGAGEGEREGLEVLGRWPGSEAPGWSEAPRMARGGTLGSRPAIANQHWASLWAQPAGPQFPPGVDRGA